MIRIMAPLESTGDVLVSFTPPPHMRLIYGGNKGGDRKESAYRILEEE